MCSKIISRYMICVSSKSTNEVVSTFLTKSESTYELIKILINKFYKELEISFYCELDNNSNIGHTNYFFDDIKQFLVDTLEYKQLNEEEYNIIKSIVDMLDNK